MESKHTPGPWRVGDAGATVFGPKTEAPSPVRIATVTNNAIPSDAQRANARLIAAAPELLDACEEAIAEAHRLNEAAGYTVFNPTAFGMMRQAIAKAQGK